MEDGRSMDGSMTNSPRIGVSAVESARKLVGLVLKVEGEATLVLSDSVWEEYDGGGW